MSEEIDQFSSSANSNENMDHENTGSSWAGQVEAESIAEGVLESIPEEVHEAGRPDDDDYDEIELPQALGHLISVSGVSLISTPENTWSVNGYSARLKRNLSVTFSVDAEVTGFDILEGFTKAEIDPDRITSIQYRGSNRSWVVSFTDQATKEAVLEMGRVKIKDFLVFLGDADLKTVIVKIYEAPPEMPDTVVIGRLSYYGRVLSFRRDRGISTGIFNGVRTARMRLAKNIPSSVRIAGESVSISYVGQPKTCRKCGDEGHLASGCKNPRCYNCESPGHRAADCQHQPLCGICLESKHPIVNCPFLVFSANVSNNEEDPGYAGAVKSNSVGRVRKNNPKESDANITPRPSVGVNQPPDRQDKGQNKSQDKSQDKSKSQGKKKDNSQDKGNNKGGESQHDSQSDGNEDIRSKERSGKSREKAKERRIERERERHHERTRDRERDRDRDWSRPREHSRRDRGDHDRHRDRDRDRAHHHRRDRSPPLYSSDSDYDDYHSRSYR